MHLVSIRRVVCVIICSVQLSCNELANDISFLSHFQGLHDPILLKLAKELHEKLPRIMNGHYLKYMWAYKYDSEVSRML